MIWAFLANFLLYGFIPLWSVVFILNGHQYFINGFISLIVTLLVCISIKNLTRRPRPYIKHAIKTKVEDPPTDWSFPSGHTATATSLSVSLYFATPILGIIGVVISILLGISRIITKVHSIPDVIFGAIVGIIISVLMNGLLS